jgi:hypothetical protein
MKFLLAISFLSLTSCLQSTNSNSFDRSYSQTVNIDTSTAAGERLYAAYMVLKNNCMNCHTGYHDSWTTFNTDQKWIESTLVEVNDGYSSSLIINLKNIGGSMPKDRPQLPEEDLDILLDWIDNI